MHFIQCSSETELGGREEGEREEGGREGGRKGESEGGRGEGGRERGEREGGGKEEVGGGGEKRTEESGGKYPGEAQTGCILRAYSIWRAEMWVKLGGSPGYQLVVKRAW